MKRYLILLSVVGALALAGCSQGPQWQYETISGTSDRALQAPITQGWEPIGLSVNSNGQRYFILKKSRLNVPQVNCDYKTVSGRNDDVLAGSLAQGWTVAGSSVLPDGNKWFLLKKPAA